MASAQQAFDAVLSVFVTELIWARKGEDDDAAELILELVYRCSALIALKGALLDGVLDRWAHIEMPSYERGSVEYKAFQDVISTARLGIEDRYQLMEE